MNFSFENKGFDFSPKSKQKTGRKAKEPTTDYQERSKKEQDRRKLATCTEYFSRVMFKTEQELQEFQQLLGAVKCFYSCKEIEEVVATFPVHKRDWKIKATTEVQEVPMWEEESTLEATCATDLKKFIELAEIADQATSSKSIFNSPHFLVFVAKDNEDMQEFLTRHKLFRYGDKYLDGSQWLADIS